MGSTVVTGAKVDNEKWMDTERNTQILWYPFDIMRILNLDGGFRNSVITTLSYFLNAARCKRNINVDVSVRYMCMDN